MCVWAPLPAVAQTHFHFVHPAASQRASIHIIVHRMNITYLHNQWSLYACMWLRSETATDVRCVHLHINYFQFVRTKKKKKIELIQNCVVTATMQHRWMNSSNSNKFTFTFPFILVFSKHLNYTLIGSKRPLTEEWRPNNMVLCEPHIVYIRTAHARP